MKFGRLVLAAATPLVALVLSAQPIGASDPLDVSLTPAIAQEPGTLRIVVQVDRHAENRWLEIEADSPQYFRSSRRELEGELAARRHTLLLKDMPAGDYIITVRVSGVDGTREFEQLDFKVVGHDR